MLAMIVLCREIYTSCVMDESMRYTPRKIPNVNVTCIIKHYKGVRIWIENRTFKTGFKT